MQARASILLMGRREVWWHPAVQAKGAAKDVGKGLNPGSSNLPNPSAAADKAAGNAKGLASDAKQGAKNVASDLSENPLAGLGDKVRAG